MRTRQSSHEGPDDIVALGGEEELREFGEEHRPEPLRRFNESPVEFVLGPQEDRPKYLCLPKTSSVGFAVEKRIGS